jgi:four helix bundle protein
VAYRSFEELEVWQKACRLAVQVYEILRGCKDYGLKDQMTRAAVSIASNIAEGAERDATAEFVRFLHIAKGSAAELRTQVYIATRIGVVSDEIQKEVVEKLKEISGMTHGLISSLKKDLKPNT